MKILDHYEQAPGQSFEGDAVKGVVGRVVIGKNDGADNFCMRIFTLSPGGNTPRHAHQWEHEIFIHEGKGKLLNDGQWAAIQRGSVIFIPGMEEHQLKNDSDQDLVFACLIPKGVAEL
ncbi:cupin domain-containing protein [Desulfogranum marinum]|uniref:cupin domain-containing protein n=1 Tax=Desulfogranum marinum TaxID=453220 RepID=UPI001E3AEAE3|nr:cupin domain-containing protein [Desulfogranum marinum]